MKENVEGVGLMILEELKLLKSFGASLDGTVTETDLSAKEQELGIPLPEALRELYLTFNPEDPMFTTCRMIPLAELTVRKAEDDWQIFQTIPVLVEEKRTYGPAISAERKYGSEKPCWMRYKEELGLVMRGTFPKKVTNKPLKLVRGSSGRSISTLILSMIGTQIFGVAPSLADAREQDETGRKRTPQATKALWDTIRPFRPIGTGGSGLQLGGAGNDILFMWSSDLREGLFAARTDEPLEQLIRETGAPLEWIRSQNGNVTSAQIWVPELKARDLYSIAPILSFLRDFAGVTETGLLESELQKMEDKLGPLPLPIREYYTLFPKAYYKTHNTLRPLSSLRKPQNGILCFLEENQNCCRWGFSQESPFLYCQEESRWEVNDYLDTFLAQEFAFELMSREELGLEFAEVNDLGTGVVAPDGSLGSQLQEIAGLSHKLAWDFGVELFQSADGKVVFLYDHGGNGGFLISKDLEALEKLTDNL